MEKKKSRGFWLASIAPGARPHAEPNGEYISYPSYPDG